MKNLWIQTEPAFVTWTADLTEIQHNPDALFTFLKSVFDAGSKYEIFTVVEAPEISFARDAGANICDRLVTLFKMQNVVDLFAFTGAAMAPGAPRSSTVEAKLAWYDGSGKCIEGLCTDLATILQSLEPVEDSIPTGFMKHLPPLRVTGPRLTYNNQNPDHLDLSLRDSAVVYFAIHSDIWFPWLYGSAHPLCDHKHMFDNRELAQKHTPRLNNFLQDINNVVTQMGGTWSIYLPETGEAAINWLNDNSLINLFPEEPEFVMPNSAYEVEWF